MAQLQNYSVRVVRGKLGTYHYNVVSINGQVLSTSQRYFSKSNANRAAKRLANELNFGFYLA